jgi:hypothetical protein
MIRDLSGDFFRFLDALAAGGDAWPLYRRHYLERHRSIINALREQVLGIDWAAWRERVERVRPGHYGGLRALLAGADLRAMGAETLRRCRAALPCGRPARRSTGRGGDRAPEVSLVVGFFSPDAFLIRVHGRRHIAVGLERLRSLNRIPLLIAHEYGHWARRRLRPRDDGTLGERMASEGVSIVLTRAVYPRRPLATHLGVSRSRLNALQEAETAGWEAVAGHLDDADPGVVQRFLSGVGPGAGLPPRMGVYLGHRAARALRRRERLTLRALAEKPWERFFAAK